MKVSLLNQTPIRALDLLRKTATQAFLAVMLVVASTNLGWAEGSIDFLNPPSAKRLWLDTRDPQQFKVYANAGEFINVGASHLGFDGSGFISVYRPDGTLAITYNDLGATTGLGVIENLAEELAGPNGGGTTNGLGYTPGVVTADMAGVWTVIFDYNEEYNPAANFGNIANNFPWTAAVNQNEAHRRAILAWDITITTGAAGNQGGTRVSGRVYTQQFNGLINGNSPTNITSPTFYVLTKDGYRYQVDIVDADPYRFPISSNSLGLVRRDAQGYTPMYKSLFENAFTRSADPTSWTVGNVYFYEPQAADNNDIGLINNKIFLNPPDPNMPATAMVVDIYENTRNEPFEEEEPHEFIEPDPSPTVQTTWLYNGSPQILTYSTFVTPANPGGLPCASGAFLFGKGGYFVFDSNIGGNVTLQIDINNNGSYNDPVDVTLLSGLNAPLDSVYWDGHDGLGVPVPVQDNFPLVWQSTIQYGEIHIANADVENNYGGVKINLLNPPAGDVGPTNQFAYNHTDVSGPISCPAGPPCSNTTPLLTTVPYIYQNNLGDDKYLDEWTFRQGDTLTQVDTIDIVIECCVVPTISAIVGGGTQCTGQDITLTAVNTAAGVDSITYVWSGPGIPGGQVSGGPVSGSSTISLNLPNIQANATGLYTLVVTNVDDCTATPVSTNLIVAPTPVLTAVSGGGNFCENANTTLVANNATPSTGSMICTWTGPNGFTTIQNVNGNDPISVSLTNMNSSFTGTYTLVCITTPENCSSNSVSFNVQVNAVPEINGISPNGDFCEGAPLTLTASNNIPGTGDILYFWSGPNGPVQPNPGGPAPEIGPFPATIPSLSLSDAGTYSLYLETLGGCRSTTQTVTIGVNPSPDITISGGGDACIGQDVTLTASNSTTGTGPVSFTWTNGAGSVVGSGTVGAGEDCTLVLNDVTAANTGTYTIIKTIDATGCSSSASINLNVLPGLNIVDLTPDTTICEFSSLLLTATNTVSAGELTYTWTGPNNTIFGPLNTNSDGNLSAIITEASPDHSGPWILTVTSETGCNASDTVNVTVLPGVRIVDIIGDGTYCANAILSLTGIGEGSADSVSFTWTDPNQLVINSGSGLSPAGPFPAGGSVVVGGIYTLEVVATGGTCRDTETASINITDLPIATILNNDTTLCNLDTLQICGQASGSNLGNFDYIWTTPNDSIIIGTGTGNTPFCNILLPLQNYGEGIYTLVVTANGCTSEPDSFTVTLNSNPTISTLSGGGTYCEGDTAQICFSNTNPEVVGFNYTCILPDGTQIFGQTNTNEEICFDAIQEGEYCCSIESFDACVSSLACTTVNYEPGADLEVPDTIEVCANEILQLTGVNNLPCSGNITYAWSYPNGTGFPGFAPCGGPFNASLPNPVSGQYCLIAPFNGNCPDTACVTVIVHPVPQVVNDTIFGGGEFCVGEQTTLTATVTISDNTPITYTWCLNDVPIPNQTGTVPSGSVVTLDLGILTTDDSGNYCLKLTSANGCENDPPTCTEVIVNPTPEITGTTGGGTYCEGLDVQLSGTGTPGLGNVTYMWMGPNNFVFNGGPVPSEGPFPATVNDIPQEGDGEYMLIVKLGDCQDTAIVIVVVNPKPIITIVNGGGTFCAGEKVTVSFTIDPNGADSVFWNLDCGSFADSGVVTTVTTINIELMPMGDESCTITARSEKGCEADPKEIEMTEQQLDDPVITANGDTGSTVLCEGDGLVLATTAQTGTNVTYCWFLDGVLIDSTDVPTFSVDPPLPGSYTVTVKVDNCTASSQPVIVTDPEGPIANDDVYDAGAPGPVNGNVLDNDDTSTGVTITVDQPSNGSVVVNQDGTFTYTPGSPAESPVTFNYTICLVDCPEECDEATVTINFVLECIPPNIITPDGSPGSNDFFQIDCLGDTPGNEPPASLQNNVLRIFNRWGDEIYIAEPYKNEWNGLYGDDEKPVPAGTYYYLFILDKEKGNGDDNVLSGYIKVVR